MTIASSKRLDVWLLLTALVCGGLFFASLHRLWPLAPVDLHVPHQRLEETARRFLTERGVSTTGFLATVDFREDTPAFDYLEYTYGRERTAQFLRDGLTLITYEVTFRQPGNADISVVSLLPNLDVASWRRTIRDDEPGAQGSEPQARQIAAHTLKTDLNLDPTAWREVSVSVREFDFRKDYSFTYERLLVPGTLLKDRVGIRVAGDRVVAAVRATGLPPRALEDAIRRDGYRRTLDLVGMILVAASAFGAYLVFLLRLREGLVQLRRPLLWAGFVFLFTLGAAFLQPLSWEPLLPRAVAVLQTVFNRIEGNVWSIIVLMALIAAGDATDRQMGAGRGETLWRLTQGKVFDRGVGRATGRGFLVGLICGGTMTASVLLLERLGIARVEMQPRGFFITMLAAGAPSFWTLLYFLHIALLEELGYRYFAGTWLLARFGKPWVAILLPALVYGISHTGLPFLPPADPFWTRPLVMTLVGCIWGWAFLRFDALTVIVSHLTADLFIFNWPQIASGDLGLTVAAVATVALPLVPTLGLLRPAGSEQTVPNAGAETPVS